MTQPMIVESLIRREKGTVVELDGTTYKFTPDASGAHTAIVSNPDHLGRFLAIREGYRLVGQAETGGAPVLNGARGIGPQAAQTEPQPAPSPAPVQEPEKGDSDSDEASASVPEGKPLADMGEDELRSVYEAEVGRKPHPDAKPETMIARIEATRAEAAKA